MNVFERKVFIIAGPNGAGKTTFTREYLSNEKNGMFLVNADLMAAGFSPAHPEAMDFRVGRILLRELDGHVQAGRNFVVETTLAGRHYVRRIAQWRSQGYRVKLLFLEVASPETAIDRVNLRVRKGGHGLPESVIRRRFHASLRNFHALYCSCVDCWQRFDNSGPYPVLIEEGENRLP